MSERSESSLGPGQDQGSPEYPSVRASDPVAWVAMGFSVDQALLDDLRSLTSLHVSFLERDAEGRERLVPLRPSPTGQLDYWFTRWKKLDYTPDF